MGHGQSPTPEELKFIYNLFLEGYSDAEVLKKYEEPRKEGKLGALPYRQDIRFVRQRRKEFEVLRALLELRIKQQLDPALEKAREDHLNNIRAQIESWKGYICVRDIAAIDPGEYSSIPLSWQDLDNKPLFNVLKQHLPFDELWNNWDTWKERCIKYLSQHRALREQILKDAKLVFNLPAYQEALPEVNLRLVPHLTLSFEKPFLDAFADKANGGEPEFEFHLQPYPLPEKGMTLEGLHIGSHEVLIAEKVKENCEPKYQKMLQDYLQKKEVAILIKLLDELRKMTDALNAALDKILERHDYIQHACDDCPGQPTPKTFTI